MCGIVGYAGRNRAAEELFEGLKKLEYRGYDSAGISTADRGEIFTVKRSGMVEGLAPLLKGLPGTECMMTKVSRMIINMAISIMPSRFRINLAIPLPPLRQSAAAAGPRFTGAAL